MAVTLKLRFSPHQLRLIDHAAGLQGKTREEFVRDAALAAAEDILDERTRSMIRELDQHPLH